MNEYGWDNRPRIDFYSIECLQNGEYRRTEVTLQNEVRNLEGDNLLNKSDYVFETIKLVLVKNIRNQIKLKKLLKRIDGIEDRILDFELPFDTSKSNYAAKSITNDSKDLCDDICDILNELRKKN